MWVCMYAFCARGHSLHIALVAEKNIYVCVYIYIYIYIYVYIYIYIYVHIYIYIYIYIYIGVRGGFPERRIFFLRALWRGSGVEPASVRACIRSAGGPVRHMLHWLLFQRRRRLPCSVALVLCARLHIFPIKINLFSRTANSRFKT